MRHLSAMWASFPAAAALSVLVAPTAGAADKPAGKQAAHVAAAPDPASLTLQQQFDAASAALDEGKCDVALPLFTRLADDRRVKRGTTTAATIAVRRGRCLTATGQTAEGEAQLQAALAVLKPAGAAFRTEVLLGELTLGAVAAGRWDHDAAVAHYRAALDLAQADERVRPLMRLAQVTAFDGGDVSLGYADQAIAQLRAEAKPDKVLLSRFYTLRGRTLLNQGRARDGYADLKQALSLRGGLTTRIDLDEVTMRYDLAQAALLNKDPSQARLYLAYSGSGRIEKSPFTTAARMAPPACGPETGLVPEDIAVVEFSIGDDGLVAGAQTVYVRGNYAKSAAFARAVKDWRWDPDKLARVPPFYRLLTRVEVRCTNAADDRLRLASPLTDRLDQWIGTQVPELATGGVSVERVRAIAAEQQRAGSAAGQVAAAARLALESDDGAGAGAAADLDQAIALARQASLPEEVINALRVERRGLAESLKSRRSLRDDAADMTALSNDPAIARDALAQDTLLLGAAENLEGNKADPGAGAGYARVAADDRLGAHHPLRQFALLKLADLAAQAGRLDDAQGYFARTGLSEQQCALIGVTPAMKSSGASSSDYPMTAMMMGFEGWVQVEFDINADGTTARARPLIAYPPFLFVETALRMAGDIRYRSTYRPSGGSACSANTETIRFELPK